MPKQGMDKAQIFFRLHQDDRGSMGHGIKREGAALMTCFLHSAVCCDSWAIFSARAASGEWGGKTIAPIAVLCTAMALGLACYECPCRYE